MDGASNCSGAPDNEYYNIVRNTTQNADGNADDGDYGEAVQKIVADDSSDDHEDDSSCSSTYDDASTVNKPCIVDDTNTNYYNLNISSENPYEIFYLPNDRDLTSSNASTEDTTATHKDLTSDTHDETGNTSEDCNYSRDSEKTNAVQKKVSPRRQFSADQWQYCSEICAANLTNTCTDSHHCTRLHFRLPYLWQKSAKVKGSKGPQWAAISMSDNEALEQLYCDPASEVVTVKIDDRAVQVDFNKLYWEDTTGSKVSLKRLTTPPATTRADPAACTRWLWYYLLGEDQWQLIKKDSGSNALSLEIEAAYQKQQKLFIYQSEGKRFVLNLKKMNRKTAKTGYKTRIKRRPAHIQTNLPEKEIVRVVRIDRSNRVSVFREPPIEKLSTICSQFLQGKCRLGDKCNNLHCALPYQWIWITEDKAVKWLPTEKNEELEAKYCDPSVDLVEMQLKNDDSVWKADLQTLSVLSHGGGVLLRACTLSADSCDMTDQHRPAWMWYWWGDNHQWIPYLDWAADGLAISSSRIEKFCENSKPLIDFTIEDREYQIDLLAMTQTNISTGKVRAIKRRPKKSFANRSSKQYPAHWRDFISYNQWHKVTINDSIKAQMEDTQRREYLGVIDGFTSTCKTQKIVQVECIQNYRLYDDYISKKEKLALKWKTETVTEKLLFHGTKQKYLRGICQQGFDFRLAGQTTGTLLGRGSYFARDASYSKDYAEGGVMLVAKVLVGKSASGSKDLRRPPEHSDGCLYDSCVDKLSDPSIYVIFDLDQAYPAYVIHYK